MWDSFNGRLMPSSFAASTPSIHFQITPMDLSAVTPMGAMGMVPPSYGMFPGMMGALPYDTYASRYMPSLKEHEHSSASGTLAKGALAVLGVGVAGVLGLKAIDGIKKLAKSIKK